MLLMFLHQQGFSSDYLGSKSWATHQKKNGSSLSRAPFLCLLNGQATGVLKNPLHVQEELRMNK